MLHPRKLISRNYHHISSNPRLTALFPRENLVGGTRGLKNLQELLSPTVQKSRGEVDDNYLILKLNFVSMYFLKPIQLHLRFLMINKHEEG